MEQVGWQQGQHDSFAVGFVQELDDDLHIGGHEDLSVLFSEHFVHEDDSQTFFVLEDPVSTNASHVDGVCLEPWVFSVFSHNVLEIIIIYIRTTTW